MIIFRPAQEADLAAIYEVFYQNEVLESAHPPTRSDIPAYLGHVLRTGALAVAEQDGTVLGYAGAITRGTITFLTDLFIHPLHQSGQLGKKLLQTVLPQDSLTHCTLSSSDPRALALYIRAGMAPKWPSFKLRLDQPAREWPLTPELEISEAEPQDLALLRWDARSSGRERPLEHLYWVRAERAVPLWFWRDGQIIGYGYLRPEAETPGQPAACTVGPIGVSAVADALPCVLAAVGWTMQRAAVIHITVPGPHPSLTPLLEHGFRIVYLDTFVSSAETPFFDARFYIPSGGDLF